MRVGGIRSLIIPPDLAYGKKGFAIQGTLVIPPDAALEFDIELLDDPNPVLQWFQDTARLLKELRTGV